MAFDHLDEVRALADVVDFFPRNQRQTEPAPLNAGPLIAQGRNESRASDGKLPREPAAGKPPLYVD